MPVEPHAPRAAMAAGGHGAWPPNLAADADAAPPPGFEFITRSEVPGEEALADPSAGGGCACAPGACSAAGGCACALLNFPCGDPWLPDGRLAALAAGAADLPHAVFACGARCACGGRCAVAAPPPAARLRLRRAGPAKGLGLFADAPLEAGALVGEYFGEYVTRPAAAARLAAYDAAARGHALLVARERLPSGAALRAAVDATRRGGAAAFANHACGAPARNAEAVLLRPAGALAPRVALFALRGVAAGEELCFSYGAPGGGGGLARRCACGAAACRGLLPDAAAD